MSLEEELKEGAEHAHRSGEKGIGLTMAIVAVLLAIATLMGHRTHTEEGLIQGKIETEASGGINLENVIQYAETGVDFVSIGGLIHQARSLDLSLKAVVK